MQVETQEDYWAAKLILSHENKDLHVIDEGPAKINMVFC